MKNLVPGMFSSNFLKKVLLWSLLLLVNNNAFAVFESLTVNNRSNFDAFCAFVQWDQSVGDYTTYHWYPIANGQSVTFNMRIDSYHCIAGGITWSNNMAYPGPNVPRMFCTTDGATYRNPIYSSHRYDVCNSINGEMKQFGHLPNVKTYNMTLIQ
ncbi:MAG: hypothetical protein HQK53_12935 [Oligoflexia bacterium]|nr:hypothetical protein [Oligoflexia bacterium]